MVGVHFVDQPDLHSFADREPPVDRRTGGTGGAVDQLPAHVVRGGQPVDLHHVVFPFDAAGSVMTAARGRMVMAVRVMLRRRGVVVVAGVVVGAVTSAADEVGGQELHAARGAAAGL